MHRCQGERERQCKYVARDLNAELLYPTFSFQVISGLVSGSQLVQPLAARHQQVNPGLGMSYPDVSGPINVPR